jgi:hypothetical protein
MRRYRLRMRTRLLPRRITLAALVAVSAIGGARADDADPPAAVAGPGDAEGSVAAQPAAAQPPLAMTPNTRNATPARGGPASRTQPTSLQWRARKAMPSSAHHRLTPAPQHVGAPAAAAGNQVRSASAPVNRPRPATAPSQATRQATSPAPYAAPPPVAHEAEPVVTQTQANDPDPRDAGPHADRTSRDRAER